MLVAGRRESGPLNCSWAATETAIDTVCLSPMSVKLQNTSICWSNRKKKTDNNSCKIAVPCPIMLKYLNWKFNHQKVCPALNPSRLPPVLQPAVHRVRGKWGESVQSSWQGEGEVGRVSPVQLAGQLSSHHHHYHHHKKSKSSENISHSGLHTADKFNSQNPFPFSLSTPKSSLASFMFFKKQQPKLSAESLSSTSSVCVEGMTEPTMLSCLQMQLTESVETYAQVAGAVSKEEGPTTQWTDGGQTADHSHS